ncbi:MAG TPA: RDD family protein [Usitatibacter sp.]|nr:RDD family protein [Usitatibacter sp.]
MSDRVPRAPSIARRLAAALYDALLIVALMFVATYPFLAFFGDATHGWRRHALQAWIVLVVGFYFVWFWTRGGQTLPMKTWHIRLVRHDGAAVGTARAIHRFALALLGAAALGLGFLWALFDRDRQFLHDRLSGTALIDAR